METSAFFSHALLLSEDEAKVSIDRTALRQAGILHLRLLGSGAATLDALANPEQERQKGFEPPRLLICHPQLADMDARAFVKKLGHTLPQLALPLLVLSEPDPLLMESATGPLAFLPRPYTQAQLGKVLRDLRRGSATERKSSSIARIGTLKSSSPQSPQSQGAPVLPSSAITEPGEPQSQVDRHIKQGLRHLQNLRLQEARLELEMALTLDPHRPEVLLALGRLHQQRQEFAMAAGCLLRAAKVYLEQGSMEKAGLVFSKVPRRYITENPFVPVAENMLQEGNYKEAALAFVEAHKADPQTPLHSFLGRACQFTDAPEVALRKLCSALAQAGHAESAGQIWRRMVPAHRIDSERPSTIPAWIARFPVLNDVVQVASYTLQAWRGAA